MSHISRHPSLTPLPSRRYLTPTPLSTSLGPLHVFNSTLMDCCNENFMPNANLVEAIPTRQMFHHHDCSNLTWVGCAIIYCNDPKNHIMTTINNIKYYLKTVNVMFQLSVHKNIFHLSNILRLTRQRVSGGTPTMVFHRIYRAEDRKCFKGIK